MASSPRLPRRNSSNIFVISRPTCRQSDLAQTPSPFRQESPPAAAGTRRRMESPSLGCQRRKLLYARTAGTAAGNLRIRSARLESPDVNQRRHRCAWPRNRTDGYPCGDSSSRTNSKPGSEMPGVPASVTRATLRSSSRNWRTRSAVACSPLCSWYEMSAVLIS